jgi:type IV pilus assembly protein PilW
VTPITTGNPATYQIVISWEDRRNERSYQATGSTEAFSYTVDQDRLRFLDTRTNANTTDSRFDAPPCERAGGFSLIELMVALTIGLLIVAAMLANLNASSASNRTNARVAEYQTKGRFAADFLRREIQHTGFAGSELDQPHGKLGRQRTTDYGCGAGFAANIAEPIWGANDTNPFSGSCIPTANYARGDILVLRRADLDTIPAATTLVNTKLYFRSEYLQGLGVPRPHAPDQSPDAGRRLPAARRRLLHQPLDQLGQREPAIPALYRMTLGDGPAMSAQLIASGIENMQVQYGVSTDAGIRYYDASTVPASLWTSVISVRIWLLARSTTVDPGNVSTAAYTMADQDIPRSDGRRERRLSAPGVSAGRPDPEMKSEREPS